MNESFEAFQWSQLARRQKIWIGAAAVLLIAIAIWAGVDKVQSWAEVRQYEKAAAQAEREKNDALELAAKTASKIQIAEEQLSKVEVKRDATKNDIKAGDARISSSRADYERAVHERLPNVPSTDELCRQLAAAGHPCQPDAR